MIDSWTETFSAGNWCYECTRGKPHKTHFERLEDHIPSFLGDLDVDHRLHPLVCVKARYLKVIQDLVCPFGGIDHGYLVHDYQLPMRAVG